jgi:hypothetical protein
VHFLPNALHNRRTDAELAADFENADACLQAIPDASQYACGVVSSIAGTPESFLGKPRPRHGCIASRRGSFC